MKRFCWVFGLVLALASQAGASTASAQVDSSAPDETLTVRVLDNGRPVVGAQMSAMLNGIKRPAKGTESESVTNDDGLVSFPTNLLNVIKGTPVDVYRVRCDNGRVEVVLVPEGEGDPCVEGAAEPGERCDCEKIGSFIWGGGSVTIDIGTGTVTGPEVTGESWTPGPPRIKLTVGGIGTKHPKLKDTACIDPVCEVDDTGVGIFGSLEYGLGRHVVLGLEGGKSNFGAVEESQVAEGISGTTKTDVNLWWFNPYMGFTWNLGQWSAAYFALGGVYLKNIGTVLTYLPLLDLTAREERSEGGWRASLDVGYELKIATWGGVRTGYRYVKGDKGDADEHHRLSLGLFINLLRAR